ncbi:hypothetical protein P1J78_11185 [Psychromarinibacter sp. C21-152]|uniref:DUF2157 domain-containing protein n=1 Tax=Psychromarinibacter sediminicola TaxID=3033385 RepID=A0AAE3T8D3_9RHOB|nr:hypothetical protein [Psychromarinibacter sediminicola]MDF0601295.1 hypothetical protein [Psychromarinibacter sediminicola]
MIGPDDIRAAVNSGLLTERQAAALTALAHSRRGAREELSVGDEPFELFRGFNEIFIMVGLVILGVGYVAVVAFFIGGRMETWQTTLLWVSIATAGFVWLFAEYFIRHRRMVGPAMLLTCMFAAVAAFGFGNWLAQVFMIAQEDYESLIAPGLLATAAVLVFWLRFKVPFALAVVALGLFATALLAAATRSGTPESIEDIFLLSEGSGFGWITLALGLVTFAVAMAFDASDPHRVTRRASQGFWLHLVASPMIINTVALSLLSSEADGANTTILVLMGGFALIAVVIDRRSFLLAAIAYVVGVITTLYPITEGGNFGWLILALGVFLVLLGAFWARIRAGLLRLLPLGGLRAYLPPAHQEGL